MKLAVPTYALYQQPFQPIEPGTIHMEDMAEFRHQHQNGTKPHRHHGLVHAIWLNQGYLKGLIEDQPLHLEAPALLVIPPLTIHSFDLSGGTSGKNLTVSEDLMKKIADHLPNIHSVLLGQLIILSGGQLGESAALLAVQFESIWKGFSCPHHQHTRDAALFAQVLHVFAHVAPLAAEDTAHTLHYPHKHRPLYQQFHALVEEHFSDGWSINEYAQQLSVSTRSLQRACQAICGLSPVQVLHARVMLEAQRLLGHTEKSVNTIAYQLGFEDPSYFTHFFTRHMDMSPSDYRARRHTIEQEDSSPWPCA